MRDIVPEKGYIAEQMELWQSGKIPKRTFLRRVAARHGLSEMLVGWENEEAGNWSERKIPQARRYKRAAGDGGLTKGS